MRYEIASSASGLLAMTNRTLCKGLNRRNKKDAMRIALSTKRLSVYIRVQKRISYTIYLLFALGPLLNALYSMNVHLS